MRSDRQEHILIVDDVEKNIQLLAELLLSRGYNISPANSGEEALEALAVGPFPDLILLDIMMPGMSGIEVCRIIKSKPESKDIPVIFLTARTDTGSIVEGLTAGASDYVNKPFNSEELLARVGVQLENARLRRELMDVNKELESSIAARDRLLSIIGHDLKSPLGSLLGLSQMYSDQIGSLDRKTLEEFVLLVKRSLGGVLNLLANLLSWARLQGGHLNINLAKVNLNQSIREVLDLIQPSAEQKNIQIRVLNDAAADVLVDQNMLATILRNLISNAIKFTHQGGAIELDYRLYDGELEFSVKDNGTGMEESVLKNLFRIDVRHQTPGTNNETGTGLGLAICRDMIERNKGKIRAESESGRGSTFYVTLKTYRSDENES